MHNIRSFTSTTLYLYKVVVRDTTLSIQNKITLIKRFERNISQWVSRPFFDVFPKQFYRHPIINVFVIEFLYLRRVKTDSRVGEGGGHPQPSATRLTRIILYLDRSPAITTHGDVNLPNVYCSYLI